MTSMALLFAKINLAILDNDLKETSTVLSQINEFSQTNDDIIVNVVDLETLCNKSSNNNCFRYFIQNLQSNQATNKELWYFYSNYFLNQFTNGLISKEDLQNFINSQMAINFQDENKDMKYYTLIRIAMALEDYETIKTIKSRLESEVN